MCWQGLQTFSIPDIPNTHSLIELQGMKLLSREGSVPQDESNDLTLLLSTYRTRHDEVRLWVKVAAIHIVPMSLESLQTFTLNFGFITTNKCIQIIDITMTYYCIIYNTKIKSSIQNISPSGSPKFSEFYHRKPSLRVCYRETTPHQRFPWNKKVYS